MTKYVNNFLIDLGRIEKFEVVSVNETVTVKDLTFKKIIVISFSFKNYWLNFIHFHTIVCYF